MIGKLIKLAVLGLVVTVVVRSLPDIKRYIKIKQM